MSRYAPGPRGWPLGGNLWAVRKDVLGFLERLRDQHGGLARIRIAHQILHVVNEPALAREVLRAGHERFQRVTPHNRKIRDITGCSVLTTDGETWQRSRTGLKPHFVPSAVQRAVPVITALTAELIEAWRGRSEVDASSAMQSLTCRIIVRLLAERDLGAIADDLEGALDAVLAHHQARINWPFDLPHRLPTRSRRRFHAGVRTIGAAVATLLRDGRGTAVQALLEAERAGRLSARDELITLLLAGHETTATALSWSLALLAGRPEVRRRLAEDLRRVCGDDLPDAEQVKELRYARQVFQEALRLYPPIWLIDREAVGEQHLGGVRIPARGTVIVPLWTLQRHPQYWTEPSAFRPERFEQQPTPGSFLPFGDGAHACLGGTLAMTEGQVICSLLARDLQWSLPDDRFPAIDPGLTLRLKGGLRLRLD